MVKRILIFGYLLINIVFLFPNEVFASGYNFIYENYLISQNKFNSDHYPSSISENTGLTRKFKSPYLAFALTASAIPVSLILMNTKLNKSYIQQIIIPASIVFLPIPSHIYTEDSGPKTSALTLLKLMFLGITEMGYFTGLGGLACVDHPDNCNSSSNDVITLFVIGVSGFGGIYLYELIDAPFAAIRYNEKIQKQQQGFFVQPLAWKGECRVNVGYSF